MIGAGRMGRIVMGLMAGALRRHCIMARPRMLLAGDIMIAAMAALMGRMILMGGMSSRARAM